MKRSRAAAPPSLVSEGRFQFGVFDGPMERVNPLDAERPFDLPIPRALRAFRLKEWQAFQLVSPRYFVLLALFDAKTLALAQAKVYDRETREKHLFERTLPPWSFRVASGLGRSTTRYRTGDCEIAFENHLDEGRIGIHVDIPAGGPFPGLAGRVVARTEGHDPLVVAMPFAENRGMYSHKGPAALEGELRLGGRSIRFEPASSQLLMDDHKGFYPVEMKWDWVTAAGQDASGRRIALNLTRNQTVDPERYTENCLWVDGRAHVLPKVRFERTGCAVGDRWTIRDDEGRVDVVFEIEVEGRVDIRMLFLRSDYHGPFGTVTGTVVDDAGTKVPVDGLFGMGERFYLRC